jgi:hypothetical protein
MILAFPVCSVLMISNIITQMKIFLDSLVGIATVQVGRSGDRIPVGSTLLASVQTGPGPTEPHLQCVPWVKRPGNCVDHPSTSGAEVEDRI